MKRIVILSVLLISSTAFAQREEKKDTTRINVGEMEILVISHEDKAVIDTIDAAPTEVEKEKIKAHWAGLDMGFTALMNPDFGTSFAEHPYWENDPGRSMTWNLNLFEHKFGRTVGFTTGMGFSFTQTAFKDNYVLVYTSDTLYAEIDSVNTYSKNKLRATYLTVPLLLDICSVKKGGDGFYLAAGVVGGVRISSRIKRIGEQDGKEFRQEEKGVYGLNAFRLDATIRTGYDNWGAFASYNLMPLFETSKTVSVYPLTVGLTLNF
ncbi:MAG: PorT family protein [Cryomorphaceae bacterium]|jgi:hypothetical protein|nr:PorT family protein [Cryomorphaceae bacterium]